MLFVRWIVFFSILVINKMVSFGNTNWLSCVFIAQTINWITYKCSRTLYWLLTDLLLWRIKEKNTKFLNVICNAPIRSKIDLKSFRHSPNKMWISWKIADWIISEANSDNSIVIKNLIALTHAVSCMITGFYWTVW